MEQQDLDFIYSIIEEESYEKLLQFLDDDRITVQGMAALRLKTGGRGKDAAARELVTRIEGDRNPESKRLFIAAIGFMDKRTAKRWLTSLVAASGDTTTVIQKPQVVVANCSAQYGVLILTCKKKDVGREY